ncbi:MAG: NAD/NADP-dependent betaine aldehyde dehydrogenase [Phycisphaerae bacterium]|nr:NAD/NADP-dependent betaine aldehyde dehydrogenase [Phycisphaerae bacterium]
MSRSTTAPRCDPGHSAGMAGAPRLWIAGAPAEAHDGRTFPVHDPSTAEHLCDAPRGAAPDVDRAVRAAAAALPGWAALRTTQRGRVLFDVANALRAHADELALLETLDNGKPRREARDDVAKSAEAFEFYAGLADKIFGTTIPVAPEFFNYTLREPVGVTAHIAPWNYPLRLALRSVAPALAAGNTVVLKPAEETPLTALRLGPIFAQAGLPPGVFNVVSGFGPEAGAALAGHPRVNHIAFTGSVETGIRVMQAAARNVVPVTLELGGKSPNIVFADAAIDRAVAGAVKAIFSNAGQVCCAGSRLLLQRSIHDEFVARLADAARRLRVGPGIDDPDVGPLISRQQRDAVLDFIDAARNSGGVLRCGGGVPAAPECQRGWFVEPTIIVGLPPDHPCAREEIFGPVLCVLPFDDDAQAVALANDNPYGLVAGVWTRDLDRAHRVAAQLHAGQVYVNDFFIGTVACPFGGTKRSGFGRERGVEALQHYTQVKSVCIRLGSA